MRLAILCLCLLLAACGPAPGGSAGGPANNAPPAKDGEITEPSASAVRLVAFKARDLFTTGGIGDLSKLSSERQRVWIVRLDTADWATHESTKAAVHTAALEFDRWYARTGHDLPKSSQDEMLRTYAAGTWQAVQADIYKHEGVK